jgi:hypothetical protein
MNKQGRRKLGGLGFGRRFENFGPAEVNTEGEFSSLRRVESDSGHINKLCCICLFNVLELPALCVGLNYVISYTNLKHNPLLMSTKLDTESFNFRGVSIALVYLLAVALLVTQFIYKLVSKGKTSCVEQTVKKSKYRDKNLEKVMKIQKVK